jgi:hypothetical protein
MNSLASAIFISKLGVAAGVRAVGVRLIGLLYQAGFKCGALPPGSRAMPARDVAIARRSVRTPGAREIALSGPARIVIAYPNLSSFVLSFRDITRHVLTKRRATLNEWTFNLGKTENKKLRRAPLKAGGAPHSPHDRRAVPRLSRVTDKFPSPRFQQEYAPLGNPGPGPQRD